MNIVVTSLPVFPTLSLISNLKYNGVRTQVMRRRAVERESSSDEKYEVDTDKARQALQKLDQHLLSLSDKQLNPPSNSSRAKYLDRPQPPDREDAPDFSGSFLPFSAFALLLFSIFYNVLFITVIKPSVDLP